MNYQNKNDASNTIDINNLLNWLRDYGNNRLNSRLMDERRCLSPHVVLDLGNQGILGMQVSPQYGGIGLNNADSMKLVEQLAAIDLTLATFVVNNDFLGIRPIQRNATAELQQELLPKLARGRELAAFALTEPVAGSNPQAIATKGTLNANGGWNLTGTKVWSGSAAWSGVVNIFAKLTDERGQPMGISGFAIRQGTPGFRMGAESPTMGMRGMVQNYIHLDRVPVSSMEMLGSLGKGMDAAYDAMLHTRLAIGAMCVGGMKRCLQLMLRYSSRRTVSTGLLLENPVTLVRLSNMTAATTAFDALITRLAALLDRGVSLPVEAYIACKTAGPEFLWQTADNLVQLLGGRGYVETNIAAQILRDSRIFRIFEGPTETLTMFLGSRVLHQNEELHQFLSDRLQAKDISDKLREAANQINDRWSNKVAPFANSAMTMRWAAISIGEIATHALLWGALCSSESQSTQSQRAIAWVEQEFERLVNRALTDNSFEAVVFDTAEATATINSYSATIGDLEQTLAGEDVFLDPLLRQDKTAKIERTEENIDLSTDTQPLSNQELTQDRDRSIETWLVEWLAEQLNTSTKKIDINKSLFHYGLDSVTAISLIADLEDWLDREFPPALVWNYPVIKDLVTYLSQEVTPDVAANLPQTTTPSSTATKSDGIDIDNLSDDDVDSLLDKLMNEEVEA